ncbi:TniB protein [Azospirillum brasilense]|uniref:TniB protein n=1 Tax=Azospirillum brasilense TaxID=192 RepID=A0A560CSR9_AZOBR|nr:ATP-binding protein [Azospirillum brasilense]TWA87908.1 TniB protein [Azospirillum brasilense]
MTVPDDVGGDRHFLYRQMASIFVPHPRFVRIMEEIRFVLSLQGSDDEAPCMQVSGPPGVGKTTLRKKLAQEYRVTPDGRSIDEPPHPILVADHIPLLQFVMPPQPTVKSVGMEMLRTFGDPAWWRGDKYTFGKRVDKLIAGCGTVGILIDDAQRAVDRNGVVVTEELADWFKSRHDENNVSLIFLGLGRLSYLFEQDGQHERRCDAELRMCPYQWRTKDGDDNVEDQSRFIGTLLAIRKMSPLPFDVDVTEDRIAVRFFYASRGAMGGLKKLMKMCVRIIEQDAARSRCINLELLEEAFERAFRKELHMMVNPFAASYAGQMPPPIDDDSLRRPDPPARRSAKNRRLRKDEVNRHLTKR